MTEPFYRRVWFWALVAPPVLLGAVWLASLILPVWAQDGQTTVTFSRVTGAPDGPVYNMTEQEAARLPGDLPEVLARAGRLGSATAAFSSYEDFEEVRRAMHFAKYVRYQGVVLQMGLAMAIG